MDIISFDVFDTCFVRACGSPERVWWILALEVLGAETDESTIADFCLVRRNGEYMARKNSSMEDITLEEIYKCCDFSGLTNLPNSKIAALECKIEKELLIPVFSIKQKIEKYRSKGDYIIYISDTYMSEEFMMSLLIDNGFWHEGDKLYISSKTRLTKATGNLYKYIADENRIKYSSWRHHGDNKISDVTLPGKLGIKASAIKHEYMHYEKNMLNHGFSINHDINENFASVAKGVRLSLPENRRYAFASDLIAPLYVPFVYKIMQDAVNRGIGRLFFLSRDGYILYQIAALLKQYCSQALDLSYLYVSRCSLYLAECNVDNKQNLERDLKEIFHNEYSQGSFLKYLKEYMPPHIYREILNAIPDLMSETSFEKAIEQMINCEYIVMLLSEYIRQQKELLIKYFIQEGLADKNVKTAIIDLRGTGKCGKIINEILITNSFPSSFGYYLEVEEKRYTISPNRRYVSFLQLENIKKSRLKYYGDIIEILEKYFSASPHRRTVCYDLHKQNVRPVFSEITVVPEVQNAFFENMTMIKLFVKHYCLCGLPRYNDYCFNIGMELLADFSIDPHGYYLICLQNINGGDCHYQTKPIIKKLNFTELCKECNRWDKWDRGSFFLTLYIWREMSNILAYKIIYVVKSVFKIFRYS